MAIRSKGKHAAKKAPVKHAAKRADAVDANEELNESNSEETVADAKPSKVDAVEAAPESAVEEPKQEEPIEEAAEDAAPSTDEDVPEESQTEDADKSAEKAAPKHGKSSSDVNDESAEDAPESADAEADAEETAHSAADADDKKRDAKFDLGRASSKKSKRRRAIAKRFGIAAAIVVGVLGVVYLGGVALFYTHFYPNTNISMVDISLDSPEKAAAELDATVGDFSFKVKGQGMNLTVTSDQVGMDLDSASVADAVLAAQVPWQWPMEVFEEHDVTDAVADAMSASTLSDVIEKAVAEANTTLQPPVDASIIFRDDVGKFYIQPEQEGTMLDPQKVVAKCMDGVLALQKDIVLKKDERLDPTVLQTDERIMEACAAANQLAGAEITFTIDGEPAADVNATTIGAWVTVTPEFEVLFDDGALTAWAEEVGDQFNTVGSERTYVRPDGKEVTVSGGTYGWKVDSDELAVAVIDAVQSGLKGNVEIPVLQSGHGFTTLGSQDWGARYVDVDLSEQHARFYDDAGELIWESDIVSGARGRTDSPTGVYTLNRKQSPTVLIGEMTSEGEPEYESYVKYWMPFKGNSVGLHDASWQSAFGGQRYASGYGSHGCINLPTGAAGELYSLIEPGDVVVVHY